MVFLSVNTYTALNLGEGNVYLYAGNNGPT